MSIHLELNQRFQPVLENDRGIIHARISFPIPTTIDTVNMFDTDSTIIAGVRNTYRQAYRHMSIHLEPNQRFQPVLEDNRADAGWDGRTCLAIPNSKVRTETGKHIFFLIS